MDSGAIPRRGERILVIEDEEALLDLIEDVLQHEGYETGRATNGKDGFERMREGSFDLVITDVLMPEQDGFQTIRELLKAFPGQKILAMSGGPAMGGKDLLTISGMLGASGCLRKPFGRDALLKAVGELLDAR
jgi:CheY-like chemotaxis protein